MLSLGIVEFLNAEMSFTALADGRCFWEGDRKRLMWCGHEATGIVKEVRRPDEVSQMSKGDRVVTVDGVPLGAVPLGEAVEPESVVQVGLWRGGEMAALRRRLAQRSLDDGVVEVAKLACMGEPDPHPAPKPEPKPKP